VSVYTFIARERANHRVARMCRVFEVSRSGFYAWASRDPSAHTRGDAKLTGQIADAFVASRRTYGAPRIHAVLARAGVRVSRKRIARLMATSGIVGVSRRRGRRSLTKSNPAVPTAPDRVGRRFRASGPNELWLADITYLATHEGWLYLAVVMDMWSRAIVGWSMREDVKAELVVDALEMARTRRRPVAGCVVHTDRGSQYGSLLYGASLVASGLLASMGARGSAYDNAPVESVISTIKLELERIHGTRPFAGRHQARLAVFDYIEAFYNRLRLHSGIGNLSPVEFEQLHWPVEMARQGRASGPTPGAWTDPGSAHITTGSTTTSRIE
jgi:putative transposase